MIESEGTEANNFNAVSVLGPGLAIFFERPLKHCSLKAAITHRPIAFVPEGFVPLIAASP